MILLDFQFIIISRPPFVTTEARCGGPGQEGAVSVGPIWHACIAIRPAKYRLSQYRSQFWTDFHEIHMVGASPHMAET